MKKRLLSLCTALFLLLTLLPASLPAEAATYENLTYTISNGQVTITDCNSSASGHVTIPATIEGYPVTVIGKEAFYASSISGVTIPDTVTTIEYRAFYFCVNLVSVTIPSSVTSIGINAFCDSKNLSGIHVSADNPSYCSDEWGILYNKDKTTLIQAPQSLSSSYTIPYGVTVIEYEAFYCCRNLGNVTIPSSVTTISTQAFAGCENIVSVTFPDGITIGEGAFRSCDKLSSIAIPDSVVTIGGWAFKDTKLVFNQYDTGKYLGNENNPFVAWVGIESNGITNINIHPQTKVIAAHVFNNCDNLTSVTIPDGVRDVGYCAFGYCDNLERVTFPDTVSRIGSSAFTGCSSLTSITIPDKVTVIEHWAFMNCYNLTNVILPEGITTIEYAAFRFCNKLTNITIPKNVTSIGWCAFEGCTSFTEITVPGSVTSIDYWAFKNCNKVTTINFTGNLPSVIGGEIFNSVKATLRYHAGATGWNKVNSAYLTGNASNITFQTVDHFFENGSCSYCGAGDPDYLTPPVLKLSHPSLTFEDVITMNVYFSATNLENVVEMGLITYGSQVADYNVGNAEAVIPGYQLNANGLYSVVSNGIAAKDMGDTMWFAVYAKLTDGSYVYTKLVSYSPKTYAYSMLTKGTEATKKLCVALLNYGAAAQTYFSYNTGSLMNSDLTADHNAMIESYRSDMMTASVAPDAVKAANFVNNGGYTRRYPSIVFEGAFAISYNFIPSATPVGDITMYVWDQAAFDAADVLTRENAIKVIAMTPGETYTAAVDGIAAKDLDKGVYVTFCYSDGTTEYCSGILNYSIGDYCTGKAADTTAMAPLAAATAVYGYYAKQMFYA